ncbi:MAG: serine/threonine protein kinase [Gammaproteobacteria bacterium]|nr:serine/threonine protein kinase [Gammaproteobacteria bacterium]
MQTRAETGNNALPVGYQLGEYTIKSVLGHGGFGITYLAQDNHLGALVAIKEYFPQDYAERGANSTINPRPGGDVSDAEIYSWGLEEFLKEAQALAKFKHNYIVRVLRYLEANGTAYMTMEYEEGESLAKYMKQHGGFLSEPDLLRVFLPILTGLHAVHEAGLLHLDIKPDNIYLRHSGQPMLIDFGSARQRQRQGKAETGRIALTRGYSALEQYPGHGAMGPSTDVYSVGATLYRCVTGRDPLDSLERYKIMGLGKVDPMTPATKFDRPLFAPHIRQCVDLALHLQVADRPASALALQNGLMGKEAKEEKSIPMSVLGHGSGFIGVSDAIIKPRSRYHTPRGFLESLFLFLLAIGAMAISTLKIMLDTGRLNQDELFAYFDRIQALPYDAGREIKMFIDAQLGIAPTVNAPVSSAKPPRTVKPKPVAEKVIPIFDPAKTIALTLAAHAPVTALAFVRDNEVLAVAYDDGVVNLWNAESGALISTMSFNEESLNTMVASPDGQWLAISVDANVEIWSARENKAMTKLSGHTAPVMRLAFSADGKQLVSVDRESSVVLWDVAESKKIFDLPKAKHEILTLAVAPNGRVLAGGDIEGGIQYWDLVGGKELAYVPAHNVPVSAIAYSPDGKWFVSGGQQHNLKLWDASLERNDRVLAGAPDDVDTVQFSPDSRWLLLGGTSKSLEIWSVEQGQPIHRFAGHDLGVSVLTLSSDGARIATSGDDAKILIWK